jgi:cytochrome c biogenesis protein ResB
MHKAVLSISGNVYKQQEMEIDKLINDHYVIKFISDLQQVSGFLWVLWFPPPIKLTASI